MEQFHFNFPFQKVNKDKRIVTGIATAENIDQSGDIVDFEASKEAFNDWVGNIREMHGKNAVGKAVSYRPVTISVDGEQVPGIEVDAYISKGAPDTWEKVLDGTLRGFSIGGNITDKGTVEKSGRQVRLIKKYTLGELSLVDNPDNPAALFSMIKVAEDGTLVAVEKDKTIIYYCDEHKVAKADSKECSECETPMVQIGFAEEFSPDVVNKMIKEFELQKAASIEEGVDPMDLQNNNIADSVTTMELAPEQKLTLINKFVGWLSGTKDEVETVIEKAVEAEIIAEESTEAVAEVAEEVEKDGGPEVDINELTEALSKMLDEKLSTVTADIEKAVDEKIEAVKADVEKSVTEVAGKVDAVSAAQSEVAEKVEVIDEASAVKKSVDKTDEGDSADKIEKTSFWGGIFVPSEVCNVLGYDN